jgi:RNA polymerase sigma factor (sigma-70 family)
VRRVVVAALDLAEADDAELVPNLGRDPAALEEFYRRHVLALTRYATRQIGDAHGADDLVATVFLAAIESVDRYDPARGAARAWLFGIAANLIGTHHRRAAAERRATARLHGQRPVQRDELDRVEEAIDASRRTGPPVAALRLLPAAERELLALVLDQDLTVPEAAAALGIRPGTARMRLARARARLAGHLPEAARSSAEREGGPDDPRT